MESTKEGSSGACKGQRIKLLEKRLQGNSNGALDLMKALRFDDSLSQVVCLSSPICGQGLQSLMQSCKKLLIMMCSTT